MVVQCRPIDVPARHVALLWLPGALLSEVFSFNLMPCLAFLCRRLEIIRDGRATFTGSGGLNYGTVFFFFLCTFLINMSAGCVLSIARQVS